MAGRRTQDSALRTPHSGPRPAASPTLEREWSLLQAGFRCIAGIDEAGRGAWAGPVMAAAVILPATPSIAEALRLVNDSKKLTPVQRQARRGEIESAALAWAVGSASHEEIDALGILPATRLAMARAVAALAVQPDALLIDAVRLPAVKVHQEVFNFADSISLSVAAASILAKTERDALMRALDMTVPGYGFAAHKGYGTRTHQAALRTLGISPVHRRSYAPIRALLSRADAAV